MFENILYLLFGLATSVILWSLWRQPELLSFALKNLTRNKRRTIITLITIILASVANIFVETYFQNLFWGLRETTIRSELGHVQIQLDGNLEKGSAQPTKYLINHANEIRELLKSDPVLSELIEEVTTEIRFNGLITGMEDNSVSFIGRGVEAENDSLFSSFDTMDDGYNLEDENFSGINLGSGLATLLGVKVGDYVTILAQNADGVVDVLDAEVTGIFTALSSEYSKVILKANLAFAQSLISTDGVNKIMILLNETEYTDQAVERIKELLKSNNKFQADLKVYKWEELADFYQAVKNLFGNFYNIFTVVISAIVFFMIMNTMSMSIFERFREIGTLRSIGFTKSKIIFLFLQEGYLIGLFGGLVGVVAGLFVCRFIHGLGIVMDPPPGSSVGIPLRLLLLGNYNIIYNAIAIAIVTAWLSSLSPALKAAKLKIVDCLRHI